MDEQTTKDFEVGSRVQHVFFGTYGTVVKVGRSLLHVEIATPGRPYRYGESRTIDKADLTTIITWRPTSVRKVW